jgi:hypothetical protein
MTTQWDECSEAKVHLSSLALCLPSVILKCSLLLLLQRSPPDVGRLLVPDLILPGQFVHLEKEELFI